MRKEAMSGLGIVRASDFARKMFSGFQFGQGTEVKGRFNMNKMIAFGAAALCAAASFGDVTSANIVGYQDLATEQQSSPSIGFTFVPVGGMAKSGATTFKLGTIKATGIDASVDLLQVLDPLTTKTIQQLTYYSAEQALIDADGDEETYKELLGYVGWWEAGFVAEDDTYRRDNLDINVGQGFLGSSVDCHDIKFMCSGEAPTASTEIGTNEKSSPFIAFYLPCDIYLKDVTATGIDASVDLLQVLDPLTTKTIQQLTYYSAEQALIDADGDEETYKELLGYVGWWEAGFVAEDDTYRRDNLVIKSGQGFLGSSVDCHDIKFQFKSVLDLTPIVKE